MAFIPVPLSVEVFLKFQSGSLLFGIRLNFRRNEPWAAAEMVALTSALEGWRQTYLRGLYANTISAVSWTTRDIRNASGLVIVTPITVSPAGSRVSPRVPLSVCAVVTHRTGLAGRSFRGRTYWPGMTEDIVTGDGIEPSFQADLATQFGRIPSTVSPSGWTHVVVSRYANGNPRANGVTTPVSVYSVDGFVDTQRRRLPRGYEA